MFADLSSSLVDNEVSRKLVELIRLAEDHQNQTCSEEQGHDNQQQCFNIVVDIIGDIGKDIAGDDKNARRKELRRKRGAPRRP